MPVANRSHIDHVEPRSPPALEIACAVCLCVAVGLLIVELRFPKTAWAEATKLLKPKDPSKPLDGRWSIFGLIVLAHAASDIYTSMPATFFNGEAQVRFLPTGFVGGWLSLSCVAAVPSVFAAGWLFTVANLLDVQRVGMAIFCISTLAQGLGGVFATPAAFGVYMSMLRALEGVALGVIEAASATFVLRVFPPAEMAAAGGLLMSVRGIFGLLSPALGGWLYQAGGLALPFLAVGVLGMPLLVALRCALRDEGAFGPTQSTSFRRLLSSPQLNACLLTQFGAFSVYAAFDVMLQPWLGTLPGYDMSPGQIGWVSLVSVVGLTLGSTAFALGGIRVVGNAATVLVAALLLSVSLLFIGTPPLLFPLPTSDVHAPYLASAAVGAGIGALCSPMFPLMAHILKERGLAQQEFAGPLAVLGALVVSAALGIGYLVGGVLTQAIGVSGAAVAMAGAMSVLCVLDVVLLWRYCGVLVEEETGAVF